MSSRLTPLPSRVAGIRSAASMDWPSSSPHAALRVEFATVLRDDSDTEEIILVRCRDDSVSIEYFMKGVLEGRPRSHAFNPTRRVQDWWRIGGRAVSYRIDPPTKRATLFHFALLTSTALGFPYLIPTLNDTLSPIFKTEEPLFAYSSSLK
jgi:hypothetical protein